MVEDAAIKEAIIRLLTEAHLRLTPSDLERTIRRRYPSSQRKDIRMAIRDLVSQGKLAYTQHHSTTHLELNYNRPVYVGNRIVLTPSRLTTQTDSDRVNIKINDGTAFGAGDHPTTRMILQALDHLLQGVGEVPAWRALDIGTGTGVLAIAAAMLGIPRVDAVDIEPAACHEAKKNVMLNKVAHCVQISDKSLDHFYGVKYDLILANLRPPTIIELIPTMKALSATSSKWILSGCRLDECERLKTYLPKPSYRVIWQADRTGWAALALDVTEDSNSD